MSQDESSIENPKLICLGAKFAPNFVLLLSPAFSQTSASKASKKHIDFVPPWVNLRDLHSSVVSTADNCFRFLHSIASENPVFKKFLSFSTEFHILCHQIRCKNSMSFSCTSKHNFAAVLPGDSVAGLVVANGVLNFLNLYNTLLVVRLVLTWFPNTPPAIVSPLSTLCDPYLNIFRGIIPPLGGTLDLSPILAFLVLNAFTSTASALPAELPVPEASQNAPASRMTSINLTTSQSKWVKRLQGNRTESFNSK